MALKTKYLLLSKPNFENLYNAFTTLSPRNKLATVILVGIIAVLIFILPLSVISGKVSRLKKGILQSQARSKEILDKVIEHRQIEADVEALKRKIGTGTGSMTTTIESVAKKSGIDTHISALTEKPAVPGDRFTETPAELKLVNVTLKQLVDFTYQIESYPGALLRVKKLLIKPRYSNRSFLEVTMTIAGIGLREGT